MHRTWNMVNIYIQKKRGINMRNYMCDNCGEGFTEREMKITDDNSLCEFCCPQCYGNLQQKNTEEERY